MNVTIARLIYPDAPSGSLSGYCSICGDYGDTHYHRNDLLTPTSANLTSIFDFHHPHVCRFCSSIWREPKKYHRAILATPEQVLFPVISSESATDERPTWGRAIRALRRDVPRVMILTTDPKKRVWPFARISQGPTAWIYVHDPSRGLSQNVTIDLDRQLAALGLIEQAYDAGFSKPAIEQSLYSSHKQVQAVGIQATSILERDLAAIRGSAEFITALIMAQKTERASTT